MRKLNPSTDPKYFVAIVPPSPVYEEAEQLKHYFATHYQSKGALKSPPHITLHMPFLWKQKDEAFLMEKLEEFGSTESPFQIELSGFGAFVPRVVFIRVHPSEHLARLESELSKFCRVKLQLFNSMYKDRPFHPHLTIAFRDLKKEQFKIAWNEFESKPFEHHFLCKSFALLKHDGQRWNPIKQFSLSNNLNISNLV